MCVIFMMPGVPINTAEALKLRRNSPRKSLHESQKESLWLVKFSRT